MANIKLGYAPTRRSIFSAPDALKISWIDSRQITRIGC